MQTIILIIPGRAITTGYFMQIVAAYDNTFVSLAPAASFTSFSLHRGHSKVIIMNSPDPSTISCSKPCLVFEYSKASAADDEWSGQFMALVPSITQTISSGQFATFGDEK